MSIFTKLTIRNLKLNKKRTIGTIVGIMLSVALICAVSGMVTSLRQSMISTTANNTGYYHLKLSKVTDDVVEKFKNNRDVKDVNVVNDVGYSILEGGTNSEKPYIHLYSLDKNSFDNMRLELKEGEYPKNSNEIAINEGKELFKILENNKSKDCTLIYEVTRKNGNNYFELNDNTHLTNFATNEMRENGNDVSSYTPKIYILGLNDEDFKKYVEEMNLHYEEVKDKVILNDYSYFFDEKGARTFARYFDYREGDKISGKLGDKNIEFSIAKITEEKPRGMKEISYPNGEIILNIDEYKDVIDFVPTNLTINTDKPSELEENLKNNYKDVHIINLDEQVRFNNAVQLIISIFAYGFIVVITLIGVTNIFNTLTSNIELRQKEFAMLKSIGMTKKEFNRMVNLETVFYSFKALIYGIILGLIASFAIYKAFAESMNFGFIWPIGAMLISIIFVFIIVFIIMRFAIGKVNKQNIIETIRKENV